MQHYPYILIALLGGIVIPIQIGLNASVSKITGNPLWASAISFMVGTAFLFVVLIVSRQPWPGTAAISAIPRFAWLAGVLGVIYVTSSILAAPKIGAALLISLLVAGQMGTALLLDHFGALGFPQNTISWGRVAGAVLVVCGVVLIRRF